MITKQIKENLKEFGIAKMSKIAENQYLFSATTDLGHILTFNLTVSEYWFLFSTVGFLENVDISKLPIYLTSNKNLNYCKLFIHKEESKNTDTNFILEIGFEIYLENYTSELFFTKIDCLFQHLDSFTKELEENGQIKIVTTNNHTHFISII